MDGTLDLKAIGVIHTPHQALAGTPIQPAYAEGMEGRVVVDDRYADALDDVEGFERLWLIYWMDRVGPFKPRVVPYRDTREHGLFASRSLCRPNPIGISAVRLVRRVGADPGCLRGGHARRHAAVGPQTLCGHLRCPLG